MPSANHCASTYPSVERVIISCLPPKVEVDGKWVSTMLVLMDHSPCGHPYSPLPHSVWCVHSVPGLGDAGETKAHLQLFPESTRLPYPPPLCRNHAGQFWKTQPLSPLRAFALVGSTSPKHPLFLTYPDLLSVSAPLRTPSTHLPACGHLNFSLLSAFFTRVLDKGSG